MYPSSDKIFIINEVRDGEGGKWDRRFRYTFKRMVWVGKLKGLEEVSVEDRRGERGGRGKVNDFNIIVKEVVREGRVEVSRVWEESFKEVR